MKREFAAPAIYLRMHIQQVSCSISGSHSQPMTTKTKHMDFRADGYWLYAMVEPNGTEYWGRMDYTTIQPKDNYTGLDAFCDENGNLNPQLPRADWNVSFRDKGEHALVETVVTYQSLQDLEMVINMGLKDGMESTLGRLDALLLKLTK